MKQSLTSTASVEIVSDGSTSSSEVRNIAISIADFSKWWKNLAPRHKTMILLGLIFILASLVDLILYLSIKFSILFWANDLLFIFGGFLLVQIGLIYAIRSSK